MMIEGKVLTPHVLLAQNNCKGAFARWLLSSETKMTLFKLGWVEEKIVFEFGLK